MKWVRRIAITLGVVLVLAYLGGMAAMYFLQRSFQYDPGAEVLPLSQTALAGAELVTIPTGGGATSTGWYQPPEAGRPLIVSFMHTVITEDFGHRGLAGVLVRGALDHARVYGWRVRPVCTYVQRFVADNPEYREVAVPL